jgi:hypothetical protein
MKPLAAARRKREHAKLGSKVWVHSIVRHAQERAEKAGVPFDGAAVLEFVSNPPTHCPVFGMEFNPGGRKKYASPSLDRLRPELGYVRGNLALISLHANRIKNSATAKEIRTVADWLDTELENTCSSES